MIQVMHNDTAVILSHAKGVTKDPGYANLVNKYPGSFASLRSSQDDMKSKSAVFTRNDDGSKGPALFRNDDGSKGPALFRNDDEGCNAIRTTQYAIRYTRSTK